MGIWSEKKLATRVLYSAVKSTYIIHSIAIALMAIAILYPPGSVKDLFLELLKESVEDTVKN